MQHDEVIWQVINQGFCSYKVKTQTANFCKNKYNVTGLCNRSACPLANSRYATVLEEKGVCYLYIKTIERAHLPAKMWERIRLSSNYSTSLAQITEQLQFWPNFNVHKCKQRLTKIHQYLIRMRKLKLKVRVKLVGMPKKVERREAGREKKAEKAARLDDTIVKELVQRLNAGLYNGSGMYLPEKAYSKVLDLVGEQEEVEGELGEDEQELEDEEEREGELEDEEVDEDEDDGPEFVADFGEDDEDEDDLEDIAAAFRGTPLDDGADGAADDGSRSGKGRKRRGDDEEGGDEEDGNDSAAAAGGGKGGAGHAAKKPRAGAKPAAAPAKPAKGAKRTGRVNIQYEQEEEREMEHAR